MTELINSLVTFASATTASTTNAILEAGRRPSIISHGESRTLPLMTLGRADSCSESGFNQWRDAMRMVARLPGGLPPEFRLRLWENLADRYLQVHGIDWTKIVNRCNLGSARDSEIADQIDKDLHRTGCTGFSGAKQAVLKQVLVSYARWNPAVGYCQGFNMIGAILLQMTSGNERLTLKILIFLFEGVLPEGYFSQGLRGLAVDMAVFREILKLRKPTLNAHLGRLQKRDDSPPLTDVFTMHWFLTLFIHCLPTASVLRIWDLVLLEGSEVLLRAALVLWAAIETRVLCVTSTDEFYSVMGVVTREMLEFGLMDPNSLVKCIVSVGPFPFPGLQDLRQKHRALISQDTPHKSFFLAKKELDALKRHYAAIRHRQRATTIILKGLETKYTNKGSRSTLVVPTKRQVVSPKPKPRRQGTTSKNSGHMAPSHNINNNNSRNSSAGSNYTPPTTSRAKQVTVTWDKTPKKPKQFRKRRASASSHTTDSSSSTELCDSSSDEAEGKNSDAAWTEPTEKQKEIPNIPKERGEPTEDKPDMPIPDLTMETPKIEITSREKSFEEAEAELLLLTESTESSEGSKCIDTNDSQHFLDEMSRLGKSDSFYENLSQRICELQFQNLQILTTCQTAMDKENSVFLRDNFAISPLPSPISPIPSLPDNYLGFSKNHLSPRGSVSLSPRGSISSNGESPIPRSPLSPSPDPSYLNILMSRRSSQSSMSSHDGTRAAGASPSQVNASETISNSDPTDETKITLDGLDLRISPASPGPDLGNHSPEEEASTNFQFLFSTTKTPSNQSLHKILFPDEEFPTPDFDSMLAGTDSGTIEAYSPGPLEESAFKLFSSEPSGLETEVSNLPNAHANSPQPTPPENETAQTTEEINAVIRENIAILQRLKLKPAYGDETDTLDYFEYDSSDSTDISDHDASPKSPAPRQKSTSLRTLKRSGSGSRASPSRNPKLNSKGSSCDGNGKPQTSKPKKHFNPFPTARRARVKTTKFGLYN